MFALGRRAFRQRSDELRVGPTANSVFAVGGNIRGVKRSKRRNEAEPAAESGAVLLLGHCVAGRAAADQEHLLAVRKIDCVWAKRARRHDRRNGHEPESGQAKYGGGNRPYKQFTKHPEASARAKENRLR